MCSLRKSVSDSSLKSTESFESLDCEKELFTFAHHDIMYEDPESGEQMMILPKGDPLQVVETKYKRKSSWSYGLKFRFSLHFLLYICTYF